MKNNFKDYFKYFFRTILCIITAIVFLCIATFLSLSMFFSKNNANVKKLAVGTFLETGALKKVPTLFMSNNEIDEIIQSKNDNSFLNEMNSKIASLSNAINLRKISLSSPASPSINEDYFNEDGIHIDNISMVGFDAKVMVIKDPSRVRLSSSRPFTEKTSLEGLVKREKAIAGINGGLYDYKAHVKTPIGVVVRNKVVDWLDMNHDYSLTLVGFNEDNILRIIELGKSPNEEVLKIIEDHKIRDAVTFNEGNSYFTKLIVDGKDRNIDYNCNGINPRTAIGQTIDGYVVFVVTDGRGRNGHIGANAQDLLNILHKYNVINAGNLDGGTSSSMYYNGKYIMEGTTVFLFMASTDMPTAFVVK